MHRIELTIIVVCKKRASLICARPLLSSKKREVHSVPLGSVAAVLTFVVALLCFGVVSTTRTRRPEQRSANAGCGRGVSCSGTVAPAASRPQR